MAFAMLFSKASLSYNTFYERSKSNDVLNDFLRSLVF